LTSSSRSHSGNNSDKATGALVLGILSLLLCGLLAIPTLIVGHGALREIDEHGLEGRGLASAGVALGYIALVLWGLGLLVLMAA
jgi:hypothetical protein